MGRFLNRISSMRQGRNIPRSEKKSSATSGRKKPMPTDIKPMLATLVEKPFHEEGWIYELKWDGFRCISYIDHGKVEIRSRNNKSFNDKFYPLYDAFKKWNINAVVDGEIIVVNNAGYPDFAALQTWRSEADGDLVYYIFDLLWLNGKDLMNLPLGERRKILEKEIPESPLIRKSEALDATGDEVFELAKELNLEGIIAKRTDSIYRPDSRSKAWLKIKTQKEQEAIICGYTKNEGSSKKFSALILGIYEGNELVPISPVGTGFTTKMQEEILEKLKPYETKKCPFRVVPDFNKPSRFRPDPPRAEVTWVRPKLVAEISFKTVASDGSLRHPSFKGLREDKKASEVRWEIPGQVEAKEEKNKRDLSLATSTKKGERKSLLNPSEETQVKSIDGHDLKFTNLSKVFWKSEHITKRDLLNYYYRIAPYILPHLKDRPQTLNRFPNGVDGKSFYQKDVKGKAPEWLQTHDYYSETDRRAKEFAVCSDEASLLYIANLGCIEMNPWSSRTDSPNNPDWCIIDLDPDKNTFEQVIEAANVTRKVLDAIKVPSYCKTSGSTGLHIYIPLGAKYDYEDSKEFGRALVKVVHAEIPKFTSIERLTSKRKGKIYLDFLQNRPQATVAAAYSLRPKPGATVSMPLHWEEVKKGLKMTDFTIHNAVDRARENGDIFKGVLGKGIDMQKALKMLSRLPKI